MTDFASGLRGNSDDNDPSHVPGELFEAYRAFSEIPSPYRRSYLLYLLGMQPHLIAALQGSDEETLKEQIAQIEVILRRRIEQWLDLGLRRGEPNDSSADVPEETATLIGHIIAEIPAETLAAYRRFKKADRQAPDKDSWQETMEHVEKVEGILYRRMLAMMRRLLEIDQSSPSPFRELADLVAEAKSLREFISDFSEMMPDGGAAEDISSFELTGDEALEAERVLFDLPLTIRQSFALFHVAELETKEIANIRKISESQVCRHLKLAKQIMRRRLEGLILCALKRKENLPERLWVSKSEWKTAYRAWSDLSYECRVLMRFHRLYGTSLPELAGRTGLDADFIYDMLQFTQDRLAERMQILVTVLLRQHLEGDVTLARILQAVTKNSLVRSDTETEPEPTSISKAEIIEAEYTFGEMRAEERETFELFVVGIGPSKAASILEIDPGKVRTVLFEARRQLVDRLERLVVGLVQRRMHFGNAPDLTRRETAAANTVFKQIPLSCRKPFALFLATGFSEEEIAETLGLFPAQVRRRVANARKVIRGRALEAGVAAVLQGEDIEEARERILNHIQIVQVLRQDMAQQDELEKEQPELYPLENLTDAERRETGRILSQLETDLLEVYVLCKCLDWEQNKAGRYLGSDGVNVKSQLRAVRLKLADHLTALVAAWLKGREGLPNAPCLTESESETARRAFEFLPADDRESYRRNLLTGESEEEIAASLGMTPRDVARRIMFSKQYIAIRADILAISWLREKDNGEPRWKRFLPGIRERRQERSLHVIDSAIENMDTFTYIVAELDEVENAISRLDFEDREVFVLAYGAGIEASAIAAHQKTDVDETYKRLRRSIDSVSDSLMQLIIRWLRRRHKSSGDPRLTSTEGMTAKELFLSIPEIYRDVFTRFQVKGESAQEIAAILNVTVEQVEMWIAEVEGRIKIRVMNLAIAAMRKVRDDRPVGEILLGDPKQIRFPASVWNEAIELPQTGIPAETEVSKELPKTDLPPALDVPQQSLEATKPKRSALKKVKHALASVCMLFSQLGAASPSTGKVAAGIAVPALATLAAPFLWVMSLLISGQVYGLAFVRTAPTLETRRWLVKQLFLCYSAIFITPLVAWFVLVETAPIFQNEYIRNLIIAFFPLGCISGTVFYTIRQYPKYTKSNGLSHLNMSFKWLNKLIHTGFFIFLLLLSVHVFCFVKDVWFLACKEGRWLKIVPSMAIIGCLVIIFYVSSYFLFRYFLEISRDEKAFYENPPLPILEIRTSLKTKLIEFSRLFFFALPPIAGNALHVLVVREHSLGSFFELIVYASWWTIVWYCNLRIIKRRWKWVSILTTLVFQTLIMIVLRNWGVY